MDKIRNIIFDFGCVLVDLDKQRCIDAFKRIGAADIAVYVDECRQEDLFHDLEVGNTGISDFCNEARQRCKGCDAGNEDICNAWNALLTGIPKRRLDALLRLKQDYRLALLSNTNPIHWSKATNEYFAYNGLEVGDFFEKTYLSYKMRLLKPDKAIYQAVLEDMEIKAGETLFIDDSVANCNAAGALGINTIHARNGDEWLEKLDTMTRR